MTHGWDPQTYGAHEDTMGDVTHPSSGIHMDSRSNAIYAQVCQLVAFIVITGVGVDMGLKSCSHIRVFEMLNVAQKNVVCVRELKKHVMF
jgi:hypothetical protein